MSIAVTRTKIHVPRRRADLLSRPRLNAFLLDLLDYPFTLISAPAGYGKTCLMIDLAHQASYPACWYSIDPLDREPKRFLAHLIHAIKIAFSDFGTVCLDLLDNLPDPLSPPDQFICSLVNDLYSTVSENFAIFLDDYHLLEDQPQIAQFISQFGQQMDENTHLVLSSRKLFDFPDLPLLIGRKMVKGVDREDLAFQPRELQAYFEEKLHQPLSDADSKELIAGSAGWITGLLLRKDDQRSRMPGQNKAARVTGADLDSYFAEQVFQKQPEPVRQLMLETSLFDEFNITFCEKVLGEQETISWPAFLEALTDRNLFVEQVEDNGLWVRYHHLFRDFLRKALDKERPGEKREILNRLIEIHLASREWEKAFDAARQLDDPQQMAAVIDKASSPLFHAGRVKLLAEWLEILPEEGFVEYPILYSFKGLVLTELGNPTEGLSILNQAATKEQINTNPKLLANSLVWRSTAHRFLGKYEEGISDSSEAIKLISNLKKIHLIRAEAFREIGLGYGRLGNYSEALAYLKRSLNEYEIENIANNIAQVQMDIGHILQNTGKFREAETYFKNAIPHWNIRGNNIQLSMLKNNMGFLCTLKGNYVEAVNWINQAEEHAELSSSKRMKAFITASRGDISLSLNIYSEALSFYNNALIISEQIQDSFLLVYIPIVSATCYRCIFEYKKAKKVLSKLGASLTQGPARFEIGLWRLEWGYLHLAQQALNAAREAFQAAREIFSGMQRPYEQAKALLGLCLVAQSAGDKGPLKKRLIQLENILAGMESLQPLVPEFSRHQEQIEEMAAGLPGLERLAASLAEINQYQANLPSLQARIFPPSAAKPGGPELEIRAFGDIRVRRGGKTISSSEWIHQKTVREFFFYLLSHPRGVTKEQVGLTFWQDSSPSQLSCQFKNAIYRLRRALGRGCVLFHQERRSYSFNWDCQYRYDVEDFLEACQRAESQSREDLRVAELRRAAALYQHPFAPQLDGTWAEPLRRKLYLAFEKAQLEIAAYDLKTKDFPACRDACLAILEIEPCQERAYQLCMEAFYYLGDNMNIIRTYDDCVNNLSRFLNLEPSSETKSLYESLISA